MKSSFEKKIIINSIKMRKKDCFLGFFLSVLSTIISFLLTIKNYLSKEETIFLIVFFCLFQVIVQLRFLFGFNADNYKSWNIIFLLFSFFVILIIFFGSVWIMYNLNNNLMKH
ncbi:Cytochrome bo(3) ubiquinol oxidase subunit 4 [Buchnera aphidicola (Tetraneura ulmi)]|uniref:cytochrome o ubiquinol oxidase subunit IV n=1 Tax=Buchnera aphidicola TaxID=9 RepID=UPI0034639859